MNTLKLICFFTLLLLITSCTSCTNSSSKVATIERDPAMVNTNENIQRTFMDALEKEDNQTIERMLSEGTIDAQTRSLAGLTVLQSAIIGGHLDTVRIFLNDDKTDINATDHIYYRTALHWAIIHNQFDIMKLLIASGADKKATDINGKTALDFLKQSCDNFRRIILSEYDNSSNSKGLLPE